ncbi:MAG: glutathione S-transferase family protein [Advenella sp.]|uniref:glutathione S-transferase family protein n=1 Tax=unclassified Advenella TaxID=2685285 RepID=UPI001D0119F8|nr:glutathione S-transferase [Advenella sp. FME57]
MIEPILLYGVPAGSSMGLIAALEWLGKPYRLCRVDMLSEMLEPAYLRINPRRETPVLITDQGQVLTETMAIANWLQDRDTERRISFAPTSPDTDRMHQLMAFINTGFTGAFVPLWQAWEMENPDPQVKKILQQAGNAGVINRHDKLEQMVGDNPFLLGAQPCLADAIFIGVARWLEIHQVADPARWPKIAAMRERISCTPAVAFATAIENGDTLAGSDSFLGHLPLNEVIERFGA